MAEAAMNDADIIREEYEAALAAATWYERWRIESRGRFVPALDRIVNERDEARQAVKEEAEQTCIEIELREAAEKERDALRSALQDMGLEASVCCTCDAVMQSVRPGKAQCLGCERADAAEALVQQLKAALEEFATKGTLHDLNPTVMIVNDEKWLAHHSWWCQRAKSMDDSVRRRARAALADVKEEE